jgi:hypothetical protein
VVRADDQRFARDVSLTRRESLDFAVGVADDRCSGDTTPIDVTIQQR